MEMFMKTEFMSTSPLKAYMDNLISLLEKWNDETKREGLIPTVDLLLEQLKEHGSN